MTTEEQHEPVVDLEDPELVPTLRALGKKLDDLREDLAKAEKRASRATFISRMSITIAVIGVVVGLGGLWSYRRYDQAQVRNRVAACKQYNQQQVHARTGAVEVGLAGLKVLADDPDHLTVEEAAVAAEYRRRAEVEAAKQFPYRDCTTAGISKYLHHPPPDPNSK